MRAMISWPSERVIPVRAASELPPAPYWMLKHDNLGQITHGVAFRVVHAVAQQPNLLGDAKIYVAVFTRRQQRAVAAFNRRNAHFLLLVVAMDQRQRQ